MCSTNTSSGSYGDLLTDDYSVGGSCPKKHKKDNNNNNNKVRRRGPGVAELEKIRLQEENHSNSTTSNNSNSNSTPPPLILADLVMLPPPPNLSLSDKQQPPRVSPPIFPFSSYLVNGSFPKDLIPQAPIFQRKQSSLNQINTQTNAGLFQFLEPPSNQKHRLDHFSQFLEDEKLIGMKRPWPFLTDAKATIGAISRDVKQNRSLDLRLKSPVQDSGTTICNPITIDTPSQQLPLTSIRSFPRDFPRFIPLNLQYEQQQQQQEIDEYLQRRNGGGNVSLNRKPFYSFIPLDDRSINGDREKQHLSLKNERYEVAAAAADHGIDLRLKL